jgi:hypothetical protein
MRCFSSFLSSVSGRVYSGINFFTLDRREGSNSVQNYGTMDRDPVALDGKSAKEWENQGKGWSSCLCIVKEMWGHQKV